jgi:hypothetical protein
MTRVFIACAAVILAACSSPSSEPDLAVTSNTNDPVGAGLDGGTASIGAHTAIEIDVTDNTAQGVALAVESDDTSVATVIPMEVTGSFLLVGMKPGTTQVRFFVNGAQATRVSFGATIAATLPVTITGQ